MLKCIFILLLLAAVEEISISQYNKSFSDISLKDKSFFLKVSTFSYTPEAEKSPVLAGLLSLIGPGLAVGQFHNGQVVDGAIRIAITVGSAAWFFSTAHLVDFGGSKPGAWQAFVALSIFAANWISSVPDAIIYASAKNKEIRLKNHYLRNYKKTKVGWNVGYDLRGVNVGAVVSF